MAEWKNIQQEVSKHLIASKQRRVDTYQELDEEIYTYFVYRVVRKKYAYSFSLYL